MKYFDAHCHLNLSPLLEQFDDIVKKLVENNFKVNVVGFDLNSSKIAVEQANNENIYATIGIHPCDVNNDLENTKRQLEQMILTSKRIVAIGETGFDFYHEKKTPWLHMKQLEWLNMHFAIAKQNNLALMIHIRDAHDEMLEWLKDNHYDRIIIHCFNQDWQIAKQYLDHGCYLSIPGVVTYKNAEQLRVAIKDIDLNKILIETDAPYLSPQLYRGKTNMPYYSIEVYKKIAEIKNMDLDELAQIVWQNSQRVFNLNEK